MELAIQMNSISKSFGEKKVLGGINISVPKGTIFGLLGPSGAGKTTIIKILTGQLKADGGNSSINGKNSLSLTQKDYSGFGIMMDDFGFYERLSCYDNLKVIADIYHIRKQEIMKALEDVGLAKSAKTAAGSLSKGQKCRLRLARVFMLHPSVLFLDEPTSGLDPATAKDIQKLICAERDKGSSIFLTTHNMAEAEELCDTVALLNEGNIVESGTPKELCRRYNHQRTIHLHLSDGTEKVVAHDEKSADVVAELLRSGSVETLHTSEPNLETVFMELTGKELDV